MTTTEQTKRAAGRPSNLSKDGAIRNILLSIQGGDRPSPRYIKQLEQMGMITREKGVTTGSAGRPAFVINLTETAKALVA